MDATSKEAMRAWVVVIAVLAFTCGPLLYCNLNVIKGGILDDAILDENDSYYKMDQRVEALSSQGLKTGDPIAFLIPFVEIDIKDDLEYVRSFTEKLEEAFPNYGILSLSIAANYEIVEEGGEEVMLSDPYITEEILGDQNFNVAEWKQAVADDPGVFGLLIGRDFDCAQVILLPPMDCDEITVFRQVTELLEEKETPWWMWYLKTNIYPSGDFERVLPAGWAIGRGVIDAASVSDILTLSTIGLLLTGILFFFSLISFRQAVIATSIVAMSFLWTRGSIGCLQMMGFELYERVYILLVFSAQIVAGISFAEHKFACYNRLRDEFPNLSRGETWRKARQVNSMILVTAFIAILNFATLYLIGVRGIMEVGIFSALGIIWLLILTLWFLPALHTIIGGEEGQTSNQHVKKAGQKWDALLNRVINSCLIFLQPKRRFWQMLLLTGAMTILATSLIVSDYLPNSRKDWKFLEVCTRPLDYVPGTIVEDASDFLNQPGRYGFGRLPILVQSRNQAGIKDPDFIAEVDKFSKAVAELDQVREVHSVLNTISVVSRVNYDLELPVNIQQTHNILTLIEWDLGEQTKEQLWYDNGFVIFVSCSADNSNELGRLCEDIQLLAQQEFTTLDVLEFGTLASWPSVDEQIRLGKPWNLFSSQLIVVVICALWVIFRNRKHQGEGPRLLGWRTGLVMSVPFVFGTAVIALVMIFFRVPLDQATACITALAINAAIDFSIYLVADYQTALLGGRRSEEALHSAMLGKGKVVLIDILLNCLCFAPLMLSHFIPIARLGWIMITMLIACGFGSLVIMPALLPWCVKESKEYGGISWEFLCRLFWRLRFALPLSQKK